MKRVDFLIIDPQFDFCSPKGSLFVTGADKDSERLAELIIRLKTKITDIHCTLDSHHLIHIAHPIFWRNKNGDHPNPFTLITKTEVENGTWRTTNPASQKRAYDYVKALEDNKRYVLCIWPPHCIIGSVGHTVVEPIFNAFKEWENRYAMVDFVTKGSNFWTEHYSAVQADVPDPQDPGTLLNSEFIEMLSNSDIIPISGQALSHCVANTIRDIANNFGDENIKKFVLIEDTSSNVPGFENMGIDFVKEMKARGMQTCRAKDFNI